ncbi:MAG: glutamyl-tRNA(Gln) amidotransferase subunit C [Porticoccaceae bacterium]|nr:MAG: glutamyl-tRNA(Gln) amidotransferase subunit C [Porticoccaceae bacterium]
MAVDRSLIDKLAHLARIRIDDAEVPEVERSLNRVLALIDELQAAPTEGVEPLAHPLDARQRLRPDAVTEGDRREAYLALAPAAEAGLFLVPKVIE